MLRQNFRNKSTYHRGSFNHPRISYLLEPVSPYMFCILFANNALFSAKKTKGKRVSSSSFNVLGQEFQILPSLRGECCWVYACGTWVRGECFWVYTCGAGGVEGSRISGKCWDRIISYSFFVQIGYTPDVIIC